MTLAGPAVWHRLLIGVETSHLLTMRVFLPLSKYARPESRGALSQRIEERALRHMTAQSAAQPLFSLSVNGAGSGSPSAAP
jgi:hypothetical protein